MSRIIFTDRKKNAVNKHWTARDRVRAVAAYLVLGNMARVSEDIGIPLGTLNYWKSQPWWFEQIDKIRSEENMDVDNAFTKIVKKTQEIILDRLDNGDEIVTKDGTIVRRAVAAKDASLIGAVAFDKRKILRDIPQAEQNKIGMIERLQKLEMQFTKLVTEKVIEGEVIHAEDSGEASQPIDIEGDQEGSSVCDSDESVTESRGLEEGVSGTDTQRGATGEHDSGRTGEGSPSEVLGQKSIRVQIQS